MSDKTNIITDEMRMALIRKAIQTTEGWKNLALSVVGHEDRIEKCKEFLRTIGGEIEYDAPDGSVILDENFKVSINNDIDLKDIKLKFADMLVATLENNLNNL